MEHHLDATTARVTISLVLAHALAGAALLLVTWGLG